MQESVIVVRGLTVRYRGSAREAVAGIDLDVSAGEVFGLLGPNGAGKSSTQRVLTVHTREAPLAEVFIAVTAPGSEPAR